MNSGPFGYMLDDYKLSLFDLLTNSWGRNKQNPLLAVIYLCLSQNTKIKCFGATR